MLTTRKKTNSTYRTVVVLIVSALRNLSCSVVNRPDIQMTAKDRISLTLVLLVLRKKAGKIPTNVLDTGNGFLSPGLRFRNHHHPKAMQ